jgi:plasmid stability protein
VEAGVAALALTALTAVLTFAPDLRRFPVATLTIRNLDEETKKGLRYRAARHGVSMEQEARIILRAAVVDEPIDGRPQESFFDSVRKLVDQYGPYDVELPAREPMREPPTFD